MAIIKNVIFDLGGVLLNIDYKKTSAAFKDLGIENFDELFSQFTANDLFEKLETGLISEEYFYQSVQQYSSIVLSKIEIKNAWDAMLLDFRMDGLEFLETLKGKYKLFLLSNTNAIHYEAFGKTFKKETGKPTLDIYFNKTYYSHLLGKRKPHLETYKFVLNDCNIIAEETLFIDDSVNNIEAAKKLGIKTHHLLVGEKIQGLNL